MTENLLFGLTAIFLLGFLAQWIGWRFQIPGILLLLGVGLLAGPVFRHFGWPNLDVQAIFGDDLIFPVVGMGVALILFEGGLTLNFRELRQSGSVIIRLITVGALVCLALVAVFAHYILDFRWETALLWGAVLVITGPTVIIPMLRQIRPKGRVGHILKWEGILNDPVGAVLGVLILEIILIGQAADAPMHIVRGVGITILLGTVLAFVGGLFLLVAMRRSWLPDYLHVPATLSVVLGTYAVSHSIQHESGLLTVTLLGIFLANQRSFPVKHILEFKENLQVLLIAGMFIVLGARVELESLAQTGWPSLLFLLLMIVVVRPASILASTFPAPLNHKERIFLMLMAPRGIVVTVLASVFAFRLMAAGIEDGERLFAETLFLVMGSVLFYGFAASFGAKRLGLANARPQGILLVGAQPWARMLGSALKARGFEAACLDSNAANVRAARDEGLAAYCGNIHSEDFLETIDFSELGNVLAVTGNDEINAFAQRELARYVGRSRSFKLAPTGSNGSESGFLAKAARGETSPPLFSEAVTYADLEKAFYSEASVLEVKAGPDFLLKDFLEEQDGLAVPLFVIAADGRHLQVVVDESPNRIPEGATLLYLAA